MKRSRTIGLYKNNVLKCLAILFNIVLLHSITYARQPVLNDSLIQEKMALYSRAHPNGLLFVHTDKSIYTNNETIWLSAYLIKSEGISLIAHSFLSVALVKEDSRKVHVQHKYTMQNGLSFGSVSLPDSIPPGAYVLIAYTNLLNEKGQPIALFTQPVTIKSITQHNFSASLQLLDSVITNGVVRAKVVMIPKYPNPKQKAIVQYSVGKSARQSATMEGGNYTINIPAEQLTQPGPVLLTAVRYDQEVQYLSLPLPGKSNPQQVRIRFFPEGGHLIAGLESVVGWEALTTGNAPLALRGILYRDATPVDTITTSRHGVGSFRLNPAPKSIYSLKIITPPDPGADSVFQLPEALDNGIVLQLPNAVVNDSLRINLFSREQRNARVLIHNYREVFLSFEIRIKPTGTKVLAGLPIMPKGIATITVLDDNNKPLAERLFFANFDQQPSAHLETDKPTYGIKEKVTVTLQIKDAAGKPVEGVVSLAVVQDNRLPYNNQQDIQSYAYLTHELGNLKGLGASRLLGDKEQLETILLIKGWRRYTWQSLVNSVAQDTIQPVQIPAITAQVKYYERALKKPASLSFIRTNNLDMDTTDATGSLVLQPDKILTEEGRRVHVFINEKNNDGYTITFDDPFIALNQKLSDELEVNEGPVRAKELHTKEQVLEGMEKARMLKEVVVVAERNSSSLFGARANACGDYVCSYNILNCRNHFGDLKNTAPRKGGMYRGNLTGPMRIPYEGCTIGNAVPGIEGIYTAREFYGVNTDPDAMAETQFLSTLYWEPGCVLSANGKKEFSFITGDITGKFRIVVQGVGIEALFLGETFFSVK